MLTSILVLVVLPFYVKPETRSMAFRPMSKLFFWLIVFDCFVLGWIGGQPASYPYIQVGQVATFYYFAYFLFLLPVTMKLEEFFGQMVYIYLGFFVRWFC